MSEQRIISCRNGHKLRIPDIDKTIRVICPRCHDSFDWKASQKSVQQNPLLNPDSVTPKQYEELIATYYRSKGYDATTTPYSNDYGVDVFATRDTEKIAVQAKMFGGTGRPINREMVMQLHGAKDYFDCTKAVIITNGQVKADADKVAKKLGIDVHHKEIGELLADTSLDSATKLDPFDDLWLRYIMPLAGKTITTPDGLTNTILSVNWAKIERRSSKGKVSPIPIEIFRKAVAHLFQHGSISRSFINEEYAKRGSSAVVLVLSQIPIFEYVTKPQGIRLRK